MQEQSSMFVSELRKELEGKHGVPLSVVLERPEVLETEGLSEIEFQPSDSSFRFESSGDSGVPMLRIGKKTDLVVTYEAYKRAMAMAGFPETIAKTYPAPLMMEPLNWGFLNKVDGAKAFVKDDKLLALVKPSIKFVSTAKLITTIADVVGHDNILFERLDHNIFYTNISTIIPTKSKIFADKRLERGDILLAGINFQHSLIGESPLEIGAYVYRLACSNGLVSSDHIFKWSRKTETVTIDAWFKEQVEAAYESCEHEFEKVSKLMEIKVEPDSRADIMLNVFNEYGLSERVRSKVLDNALAIPPENMFDILNAITQVVNSDEYKDNVRMIRRLQVVGGDILSKISVCPRCHSVKAA